MTEKELKRQVWGVLEDYGLFRKATMKEWDKDIRDRFFDDFLIIAKRFSTKKSG